MMLDAMAQIESLANSDVQIYRVGLESAPDRYSPVGGRHRSIDEPDPTTAKQSQAKVGVLHHGKCLVATSHGEEIRAAKEHGLIAEQKTAAPEE
jgi:hypothetical protein